MKLYLKQKVFSWKDRSVVTDANGEPRYNVEGKVLSVGKKLTVTDPAGGEVAFIRQKVLSFMPRFFVEVNGTEVAEIVKKLSLFKPKYMVKGLDWSVSGDVFGHNYTIEDASGRTMVAIHKKWMSWGDSFELDISPEANVPVALGVVLAIDAVLDAQQAAASSSSSS